eukprot:m.154607 g.154607  ORF g.154607 m.154607 type:complete len:766 (+) comp11718_c0_seq4:278-2575(+)
MAIRFKDWQRLCDRVGRESGRLAKSAVIQEWSHKPGRWESPDLKKAFKFLIPKYDHRTYQLQDKQLIKLLARVYRVDAQAMELDMHGDTGVIADTAERFFPDTNPHPTPLTLSDVDDLLQEFSLTGTETRQEELFSGLAKVCTARDMNFVVRLLKKDLRIQAQDKTVLDGLHEDAYEAFKRQKDVEALVEKVVKRATHQASASALAVGSASHSKLSRRLSGTVKMGAPIEPMLARQLKDLSEPFTSGFKTGSEVWSGVAAEIKYDGERVQVHMNGDDVSYFSRSLKTSQPKVTSEIKDYVPQAFAPTVTNCILDAEVLLVDRTKSGHDAMLPFGTLGVHKKTKFTSANVCLFVFDILWLNGESLLSKPLRERRQLLEKTLVQIPYRVLLSEFKWLKDPDEARAMMQEVVDNGLEGLMLKNARGTYNPKGRHWLKVKRNYLSDDKGKSMVDSVDLVVLGGYHGTGKKAGLVSSFLMGCQDPATGRWKTVTKVANGFDDDQLATINRKLKSLFQLCGSAAKVPSWLDVDASLVPSFVVKDPASAPVWEVGGAEFTESDRHTASRISIRFPVILKERDDKDAAHANTLVDVAHIRDVSTARAGAPASASASGSLLSSEGKKRRPPPASSANITSFFHQNKKSKTAAGPSTGAASTSVVTPVHDNEDDEGDDEGDDDDMEEDLDIECLAPPSGLTSAAPIVQPSVAPSSTGATTNPTSDGASASNADADPDVADVTDTRDMCRYGLACYRRNPDHIRRFRHGDDRDKLK